MNESSFLEAIVSEPDELSHRLVFADWLEDRGDEPGRARAAFIRAQLERAALPAYHPRARALLREEARLLQAHGASWAGDIAALTRRHQFHRGFVEEVRVSPEQLLNHGSQLFHLAPIRRVQLRGTLGLPALLSRSAANVDTLAELIGRIRVLDLNRDYVGEAAGLALLDLPLLPRLTGLHLAYNSLSPAGLGVLAASPVLASLETLEFTASASSADAMQTLLHSPQLGKLTTLSLAGARLGDRVARLLAGSPLLSRLRSLCLSHNQISPEALRDLVESPAVAHLEALDLGFNPLGAEGVRVLDRSPHLRRLRELRLSRTELGDEGACALAASSLVDRLEALDLSLNEIGPVGGMALAEYPVPARLLMLDLIYNRQLGADATAQLTERFGEDVCLFER